MASGRKAERHNCGEHGYLTVREIAMKCGVKPCTIYSRITNGHTGRALLTAPTLHRLEARSVRYRGEVVRTLGHTGISVAVMIARAFPNRPPTVDELRSRFQMSRATAYRWRAAFLDSMGIAA